jgi:hypothetical protein
MKEQEQIETAQTPAIQPCQVVVKKKKKNKKRKKDRKNHL